MTTKTHEEMCAELIGRAAQDEGFRAQLIDDPKTAIKDALGIDVPESVSVAVHEESATTAHLVLPPGANLSDAELASVVGGHRIKHFYGSQPHTHLNPYPHGHD